MVDPLFEEHRASDTEAQKSLWRLMALVWSSRYLYLLFVALCLLFGYLYLKATVPLYQAEASIMVEESNNMGAESMIFMDLALGASTSSVDNEVEILKSKSLIRQAVRDLDLQFRYWTSGWLRDYERYGSTLPFRFAMISETPQETRQYEMEVHKVEGGYTLEFEGEKWALQPGSEVSLPFGRFRMEAPTSPQKAGQVPALGDGSWRVQWTPHRQVGNRYLKALTVSPVNNKVNLISLRLLDPVPERAEDLIDQLIQVYMESSIADQNRAAAATLAFIDERLQRVADDLGQIEDQVAKFKSSRSITDIEEQSKALIEETYLVRKELLDQELQLQLLESLDHFLRDPQRAAHQIPLGLGSLDPGLTETVGHYNQLQQLRSQRALAFTPESPQIRKLDEQIQQWRKQITQHVGEQKQLLGNRVARMRERNEALDARIQSIPMTERDFVDIYRQQRIKQELYMYLLKMREETALSRSGTVAGARIIDAAERKGGPVSPDKSRILMASLALGLLIPTGILFGKELLNRRIQGREDVERRTRIPLLGMISEGKSSQPLRVSPTHRTVMAEQFRTIRTNLQFFQKGDSDKVMLVSSSMSGEGKSFFSLNLALTIAMTEKRVLLVELDLRKPRMSQDLGIPLGQGISYYLIGKANWKDLLIRDQLASGLDFIPAGPIPPNPAELLMSSRMEAFLEEVRDQYDYIILDTAPVGLVTDAQILAPHADMHLFVVRDRYTYKQQVEQLESLYRQQKFGSMGLVINGMPGSISAYYGVKDKEGRGYFDD